jgi:hypothetical protein
MHLTGLLEQQNLDLYGLLLHKAYDPLDNRTIDVPMNHTLYFYAVEPFV